MADNIATIGIAMETARLKKGISELGKLGEAGKKAEKQLSTSFTSVDKEIQKFNEQMVKHGRTIDANGNVLNKNGEILKTTTSTYKNLTNEVADFDVELKKASADVKSHVSTSSKFNDQINQQAKAQGKLARVMGQSGVQLEQFMGQVASDTPLLRALGYQATDLGIVLSDLIPSAAAVGAAIGIGSAALSMLLPQLLNTKSAVDELSVSAEKLNAILKENPEGVRELTDELLKLEKRSRDLALSNIKLGIEEAKKSIFTATDAIKDLGRGIAAVPNEKFQPKFWEAVGDISKELGISGENATSLARAMYDLQNASKGNIAPAKAFADEVGRIAASGEKLNPEMQKLVDSLVPLFNGMMDGVDVSNELRVKLGEMLTGKQTEDAKELNTKINDVTESLKGQIVQLEAQAIAFKDGEKAALEYVVAQQLGLKTTQEIPKAIQEQINAIDDLNKSASIDDLTKSLDEQIAALELQTIEMKKGKAAAIEFAIAQQIAAAGGEVTPELQAKIDKIRELTGALEGLKSAEKAQADFDRLSDSIMSVGNGFSSTGDVIVDTFGNMAQALDNYLGKMGELDKWQEQINASKKENIDVSAEQQKLDELRFKTEIQGYAAGAKAASSFFDEKTAAHKAFTAAERALTAVEIGLALKQTAVDVAAGAAKIFSQTGVLGFAGVAAMVGVMAGLGFAGGSSGSYSPPDNDFSGTALGTSEASESLSESINIQSDMLAELVDLNSNFILLANLTGGLSSTVARLEGVDTGSLGTRVSKSSTLGAAILGGVTGLSLDFLLGGEISKFVGSVKKTVQAAGIEVFSQSLEGVIDGLTIDAKQFADVRRKEKALGVTISDTTKPKYTDLSSSAERQIALVFSEIANTFESSAKILGVDVSNIIDTFVIEGFKIDLKDLEGEEIQEKLNEMFSKFADDLTQPFESVFGKYQQVGEGMFETVNRLAIEQARFNEVARLTGIELSHAFDVDTAQNVITMAGGISELASSANDFAKEFLPVSQQIQLESEKLNDILAAMGVDSFTATRQGFVDLIQSLDVTTESGATLYAQLLQLADPLSDLIDKEEKLNNQRTGLQIELLDALGREEEALAMRRNLELEAMDETLHALQLQVWAEEDRAKAIEETSNKLRPFIDSINNALGINLVTLDQALSAARSGNFDKATKLDVNAVLNQSADKFSSRADMLVSDAINKGKLLEIAKLAENELSAVDKQTMSLVSIDSNMQKLVNIATNGQTDTYIPRVVTPNNSIEPVMIQIRDMQDKMNNYMLQMVKNTMETANNTDKLYRDGVTIAGGV